MQSFNIQKSKTCELISKLSTLNPLAKTFTSSKTSSLNPLVNSFYPKQSQVLYSLVKNENLYQILCFYSFCLFCFIFSICFSISFSNLLLDNETPTTTLQKLRIANIDRVIIGHLNINSIRNKIDNLADIVSNKIDIQCLPELFAPLKIAFY